MATYPGGKNAAFRHIINRIPPHKRYIEPFLGSGAVMRMKKRSAADIGIDADARSPGLSWMEARAGAPRLIWREDPPPARSHIIEMCDVAGTHGIPIEGDSLSLLESLSLGPETVVYCDPPYMMESRRSHKPIYKFEWSDVHHRRFLRWARSSPARILISGYMSDLYRYELRHWTLSWFDAMTRGGTLAREYVWYNFSRPTELHEYTYLGENFRERERIRRMKSRWIARLERMTEIERRALLDAIKSVPASTLPST